MKRLCLAALPLAAVCGTGEARPPIGFSAESLLEHRLMPSVLAWLDARRIK